MLVALCLQHPSNCCSKGFLCYGGESEQKEKSIFPWYILVYIYIIWCHHIIWYIFLVYPSLGKISPVEISHLEGGK